MADQRAKQTENFQRNAQDAFDRTQRPCLRQTTEDAFDRFEASARARGGQHEIAERLMDRVLVPMSAPDVVIILRRLADIYDAAADDEAARVAGHQALDRFLASAPGSKAVS